jgi:hypothetical protein
MKYHNPTIQQTRNSVISAESEALEEYAVNRKNKREEQRLLSKMKEQQRQQNKNKQFHWQ